MVHQKRLLIILPSIVFYLGTLAFGVVSTSVLPSENFLFRFNVSPLVLMFGFTLIVNVLTTGECASIK